MKIYILSFEVNEYNQHGEYFVKAFKELPNQTELKINDWPFSDDMYDFLVKNIEKEEYIDFRNFKDSNGFVHYDDQWPIIEIVEI